MVRESSFHGDLSVFIFVFFATFFSSNWFVIEVCFSFFGHEVIILVSVDLFVMWFLLNKC